jgi:hypothetical protein
VTVENIRMRPARQMIKKFIARINTLSTMQIMWLCCVVGLGCMLGGMSIFNAGGFTKPIGAVLVSLSFLFYGLIGVPMIIRRELPWNIPVRGGIAVVQGIGLVVIGTVGFIILFIVLLGGM